MKTSKAPNCEAPGVKIGDYCEADGECGTNRLLNNCGPYDVYMRTAPPGAAVDAWAPIMKTDGGPLWEYDSPMWGDTSVFNSTSPATDFGNAKYAAFNTKKFNYIKACVGSPNHCLVYKLAATHNNARELFNGKYSAEGIIYNQFVTLFGVHGQKKCAPQLPGFNTVGKQGCAARWGFFGNIPGQSCQPQNGDSDGTIGFGIKSQGSGEAGAGWSSYFVSNIANGRQRGKQAWLFVREGGAQNVKQGQYQKSKSASCDPGYEHVISKAQCNKGARAVKNLDTTSSTMSNFTSKRYPGGCLAVGSKGTLYFNVNNKIKSSDYHGTLLKAICVKSSGTVQPTPKPSAGAKICKDTPNWVDAYGESCASYVKEKACTSTGGYGVGWNSAAWGTFADNAPKHGKGANFACCGCGGGSTGGKESPCEQAIKSTGAVGKQCVYARTRFAIRPKQCRTTCASVFAPWYAKCKTDPVIAKINKAQKGNVDAFAAMCVKATQG